MTDNTYTITSPDLRRAADKLAQLDGQVDRVLKPTMGQALELLRGDIADYPRATAANRPPGINGYSWYERGFGTRTVTRRSYPTSEELGRSWTTETEGGFFGGGVRGTVGTGVSYGPYVHDPDKQASFHTARGWPTTDEVVRENEKGIVGLFERAVNKLFKMVGLK